MHTFSKVIMSRHALSISIIFLIGLFIGRCSDNRSRPHQTDQTNKNPTLASVEQPHKFKSTQWDDSYLTVKWGSDKSVIRKSVHKSIGTPNPNEAFSTVLQKNANSLFDDDRLTFVDYVGGKPVKHNYYFGGNIFYMFVKDLSSQGSDVQYAAAQELRDLLNREFGANPTVRNFDKQSPSFSNVINRTVIETWENEKLVADLNYETNVNGGFISELQFSLYDKATGSEAAQIEHERLARKLSKRDVEAKKSAKKILE